MELSDSEPILYQDLSFYLLKGLPLHPVNHLAEQPSSYPKLTPYILSYKSKTKSETRCLRTGREAGKIGVLPIGSIDNASILEFTNYRADINCFVKIYW